MKRIRSLIPTAETRAYWFSVTLLITSLVVSSAGIYVAAASPLNVSHTPSAISFEGQLADNSGLPVLDSPPNYSLTFNLYDEMSGSHLPLWSETQSVGVKNGLYNVLLGSATPLPANAFDGPRWLGVQNGTDPEIAPRISIGAVPFTLNARQAQGLQNYPIEAITPQDGQVLSFSSGQWSPSNPPAVPWARIKRAGSPVMTIVTNVWTVVNFDTVRWDSGGMFDLTHNTRLTASQAGKYLISGGILFPADSGATVSRQRGVQIRWTTGTTSKIIAFDFRNAPFCASGGCTGPIRLNISTVYALSPTDFVELWVYQDALNTNLTLNQANNYAPEFEMVRVGD